MNRGGGSLEIKCSWGLGFKMLRKRHIAKSDEAELCVRPVGIAWR